VYPVCLDIAGKFCIIVGGGKVACRKAEGLLAAGAVVRVISPLVVEELEKLANEGAIEWFQKGYEHGDLQGALLVFAATDRPDVQRAVQQEAQQASLLINVVDAPGDCSFQVPASVRRGDLLITVSTNGKSPAVSAMIRKKLEHEFGQEYENLLQLMAAIRIRVMTGKGSLADKKLLFEKVLVEDIVHWIKSGRLDVLEDHLQTVLGSVNIPEMSVLRTEKK
jgi:precorrin-2 dehydrogenase/sirohydrochlorin ferrochelatase